MGTKHMRFLRRYLLDTNYTGYTYHHMYHIHIYTLPLIMYYIYDYPLQVFRESSSHQNTSKPGLKAICGLCSISAGVLDGQIALAGLQALWLAKLEIWIFKKNIPKNP